MEAEEIQNMTGCIKLVHEFYYSNDIIKKDADEKQWVVTNPLMNVDKHLLSFFIHSYFANKQRKKKKIHQFQLNGQRDDGEKSITLVWLYIIFGLLVNFHTKHLKFIHYKSRKKQEESVRDAVAQSIRCFLWLYNSKTWIFSHTATHGYYCRRIYLWYTFAFRIIHFQWAQWKRHRMNMLEPAHTPQWM